MRADNSAILQSIHVSKNINYGDATLSILQDINLVIKRGESIAILGASGAGKTTLLSLFAGLDQISSGEIYLFNHALHLLSENEKANLRLNHVGFIFQSFHLLPTLNAIENVMLPLEIRHTKMKLAKRLAAEELQKVGLHHRMYHYPGQLSGGEQQRVAIARAFVTRPALILADEITGNLDVDTGEQIINLIFALNQQQQTTLLLVTHDNELANRCERRLLLRDGRLQSC